MVLQSTLSKTSQKREEGRKRVGLGVFAVLCEKEEERAGGCSSSGREGRESSSTSPSNLQALHM
jgi:hypothetical protein